MLASRRRHHRPAPEFRRRRHQLLAVPLLAISVLATLAVATVDAAEDVEPVPRAAEAAGVAEPWRYHVLGQLPREGDKHPHLLALPHAINDSNVVVGEGTVGNGDTRAAIGELGGPYRVLLDGLDATANGINDRGEIVVAVQTSPATYSGVLVRGGLPIRLTDFGHRGARPSDINESSVIVGAASDPEVSADYMRPVIWRDPEHPERLPLPEGWVGAHAESINDAGTIVGNAITPDFLRRVLVWSGDEVRQIPNMSWAYDMNNSGTVVGNTWETVYGTSEAIPVISREGRTATRLPMPDKFPYGWAAGINDRGDAVGRAYDNLGLYGTEVGVVWPAEGGVEIIQDHTDGIRVGRASDINENGWIAGTTEDHREAVLVRMAPPAARLLSAELQRPDQPSGEWRPAPPTGLHEGTPARWVGEIDNPSDDPHVVTAEIVDRETGERVQDMAAVESIPAGGSARVEIPWDTEGLAWDDAGRPTPLHRYDLVVKADGSEVDREPFDITVLPRPLVLVHGFNADATTWERYPNIVRTHHPLWQVFAVGDGQAPGQMNTGSLTDPTAMPNTIYENAEVLDGYIDAVRDRTNAAHIDIVAHSMGGLISRQYVQAFMPDPVEGDPVVDHLVMLGTPNHGSPCAAILPLAGMYELRPEAVERLNGHVRDRRGVDMSVLAGVPVPFTCQEPAVGDGVVSIASATTGWQDTQVSPNVHTALTGHQDFGLFVLPRLVPGLARARGASEMPAADARPHATAGVGRASDANGDQLPQLATTRVIRVGGRQELTIPVPSGDATRVGVAVAGGPSVALELRSPNGSGEGVPDEQSANPVRSIVSRDDEFEPGTWHAYLWNDSTQPVDVTLTVWVEGSSTVLDGVATQWHDGSIDLRATFDDGDEPIDGATVTATVLGTDGSRREVALTVDDSGTHQGRTAVMPEGAYVVQFAASASSAASTSIAAKASTDSDTPLQRSVLTSVVVGDDPEPEPEPDVTAPQVTLDVPTTPASGWHREPVNIRIDATDRGEPASGVARIEWQTTGASTTSGSSGAEGAQVTVDVDGTTTVSVTAVDHAGNRSEPSVIDVRLDRGRPTVAISSPAPGARVAPHGRLVANFTCHDSVSGIASCNAGVASGAALPTATVGTHQLAVTAVDHAGNTTTSTISYTVTATATPVQLFDRLAAEVRAAKVGWLGEPLLLAAVAAARGTHAAPWTPLSCVSLAVFGGLVDLYTAFGWMSATHATTVRGTVAELRGALRC